MDGAPTQLLAAELGVNSTAIRRHVRNHMQPALRAALEDRGITTGVTDLAARLASLLSETEAVRAHAHAVNDSRLLLQAISAETSTVTALAKRLGIDDTELIDFSRESLALMTACARVLPAFPEALAALTSELSKDDQAPELATALSQLTPASSRSYPGVLSEASSSHAGNTGPIQPKEA